MTKPLQARVTSLLRSAGLLAGILAIIAGIFGMHVMSASQVMPAAAHAMPAPAATGTHAHANTPDHSAREAAGEAHQVSSTTHHSAAAQAGTNPSPGSSCARSGPCTEMTGMHTMCVPSPADTSLTAPLPGRSTVMPPVAADAAAAAASYAYLPGSPSPGELCISRT